MYGLSQADALIRSGGASTVLVAGAETLSRITDYTDPRSCILFGDGAGAVVVQSSTEGRVGPFLFRSEGSYSESLYVLPDERLIRMQGRDVYRHAVEAMSNILVELFTMSGVGSDDIHLVVAHQANGRILDAIADRLSLDASKMETNIKDTGNTSAASIPLALAAAASEGRLTEGDVVALTAFGAGFTWGACLVTWGSQGTPPAATTRIPAMVGTVSHLLELL
jgi:3-oxoacyl-[acyl-carrier-protein] synthase-3